MDHDSHDNLSTRSDADLARLYVDGELTGEVRQRFEARLAAEQPLRARVEFERRLRDRIAVMMEAGSAAPPADLVDRVRHALDAVTDPAELAPSVVGVIGPGGDDQSAAADPSEHLHAEAPVRTSFFTGPSRANIFAVAASIMVIGAVVLVGIFGPRIDDIGPQPQRVDLARQAAVWADKQHDACISSTSYVQQNLSMPASDLHDKLAAFLGVPDLVEFKLQPMQYEFVGAGTCDVPGAERSLHLLYQRVDPSRFGAMFSIFIVRDFGQYGPGLRAGEWDAVIKPGAESARPVYAFSDGELVYFIAACDGNDTRGLADLIERQCGVD